MLERATGFEPATYGLGSRRSTPELHPRRRYSSPRLRRRSNRRSGPFGVVWSQRGQAVLDLPESSFERGDQMAVLTNEVDAVVGYRERVRLVPEQNNLPLDVRAGFHQFLAQAGGLAGDGRILGQSS